MLPTNFPAEIISMKNHGKGKSWVLLHCIHITANFLRVQAAKLQHFQPRLGQSRVCSFEPRLQLVSILALSALPKAALKLLPWWAPKGDATRVQQVVVSGWAGLLSAPRLRPGWKLWKTCDGTWKKLHKISYSPVPINMKSYNCVYIYCIHTYIYNYISILYYIILYHIISSTYHIILYYIVLYCIILYYIIYILIHIILYYIILYCIELYYIIYYIILNSIILYYIMLCYVILYYIIYINIILY